MVYFKNRLFGGFVAGLAAGILMDSLEYLTYYLFVLPEMRSVDWVSCLIYGRLSSGLSELVFVQILHLAMTAFWGLLYIYAGSHLSIKSGYWKGWNWAVFIWFISNTIIVLLKLPRHEEIGMASMLMYFVFASCYGLILGGMASKITL